VAVGGVVHAALPTSRQLESPELRSMQTAGAAGETPTAAGRVLPARPHQTPSAWCPGRTAEAQPAAR
jgi:hypothetical protein